MITHFWKPYRVGKNVNDFLMNDCDDLAFLLLSIRFFLSSSFDLLLIFSFFCCCFGPSLPLLMTFILNSTFLSFSFYFSCLLIITNPSFSHWRSSLHKKSLKARWSLWSERLLNVHLRSWKVFVLGWWPPRMFFHQLDRWYCQVAKWAHWQSAWFTKCWSWM